MRMCIVETKYNIKNTLFQALLKLKFFTGLQKSWIYKFHLVKKGAFKLFTFWEY